MGDRRDSQLDLDLRKSDQFQNCLTSSQISFLTPLKQRIPSQQKVRYQIALEHQWLEKVVVTEEMNDAVSDLLTHLLSFH